MREKSSRLYEIMFNPNLMSMQKYEAIKTLLEESYQDGYCDGMKDSDELYLHLLSDDIDDFSIEGW